MLLHNLYIRSYSPYRRWTKRQFLDSSMSTTPTTRSLPCVGRMKRLLCSCLLMQRSSQSRNAKKIDVPFHSVIKEYNEKIGGINKSDLWRLSGRFLFVRHPKLLPGIPHLSRWCWSVTINICHVPLSVPPHPTSLWSISTCMHVYMYILIFHFY